MKCITICHVDDDIQYISTVIEVKLCYYQSIFVCNHSAMKIDIIYIYFGNTIFGLIN